MAAHGFGVTTTFLGAAGFALVLMTLVRVVPAFRISIDFTQGLTFEPAPVKMASHDFDPRRLPAPQDGPVSIVAEFQVEPARRNECLDLMRGARLIFLRNGAYRWHLYEDLRQANRFRMEVVVPSWKEHLLQRERMTKGEKAVIDQLRGLRTDPNPPEEWVSLSVEKEVFKKRMSAPSLAPDYLAP
jgi:hypothetical protein